MQILDTYQVKATVAFPICFNEKIWGLLVAQQCSKPRTWSETEITLLYQIAVEMSLRMQPAEFQEQLEMMARQEEAIGKVIRKIQRTKDIKSIFKTATQEVRQILKADRSVIYRFYPDWSGEVVAESVAGGWISLDQCTV